MKKVSSYFIKIFSLVVLTGVLAVGIGAGTVFATAGVSDRLSYQGRLTDQNGSPKTGTHYICYSIYDAQSGGTKLWPSGTPTATSTMVSNGVFNAPLGEMDSLASYDFSANGTEYLNVEVSATSGTCGGAPFESLSPRQPLSATPYARVTENLYGGEAQIGDPNGVTSGQKLLKLAVKSVADTVGASGCSPNGAMWYNSGNARTLVCNNNLYQVVGSPISNQYFDISGPTLTGGVKTFAFPDSNATVLTSANAVTAAQGGTGQTTYTIGDLLYASATNALSRLADVATGKVLISGGIGVAPSWGLPPATTNALLDGTAHTDTTAGTVARGDIITGQTATPKWTRLAKGTPNQVLAMDGTATDVVWTTPTGGGDMVLTSAQTNSGLKTFNDATLGLRNVANTFTSLFTNTNTVARTYTLPDVSGTVLTSGAAVTVAQGGTGLATLTLNNLIYGNGTSNALLLAPGATTGAVLMNTATGAPSWALLSALPSTAGALPVANGGTGLATLTLNNVILGNGTTAPTFVAPSTAGNLLQSNGTTWTSVVGGVLIGQQNFTVTGTYTPTAGTTKILVQMWGGGGAGGSCTNVAGCAGGGGGSGGYAEYYSAAPVSGAVTINAGGTAVAGAAGNAGGTTVLVQGATTITANGGGGGQTAAGTAVVKYVAGGAGGAISTNGTVNGAGAPGEAGKTSTVVTTGSSGHGGSTSLGGGGVEVTGNITATSVAGVAAVANTGSGGSGARAGAATAVAGGAGAAGRIVIWEFR